MIAAILGTLKAGSAYVPLDPNAPAERLRMILADTRPRVLVTQRSLRDRLPDLERRGALHRRPGRRSRRRRRRHGRRRAVCGATTWPTSCTPRDPPGRPKGVMVEHRAICNTILWRDKDLTVHAGDVVLNNLHYTFDPSLGLIFPTLASGARMVLAEPGEEYDPHRLLERVVMEGVTILEVPPALLRVMLDDPLLTACRTLRWVCCGGEAMPPDLPARLFALLDVELYNLYGPTEAAVDATWWACRRGGPRPSVPIGRPIANAQAYILDANRQPVAPGVPGELYIGGAGLARGYLERPRADGRALPPRPVQRRPRRAALPDGRPLPMAGRRCDRVPGTAGPPGEDSRLPHRAGRGGIRAAEPSFACATRPSPSTRAPRGASRLVAYVVGDADGEPLTAESLRRHLKDRLPEYMVPAAFVTLAALPRTTGGKVDRRALPAPPTERPATARPYIAPSTPWRNSWRASGATCCEWSRSASIDNFFELGGNSIQGAVLINRLQEKIGHHVSVDRALRLADHRRPGTLPRRGVPGRRPPRLRSGVALGGTGLASGFAIERSRRAPSAKAEGTARRDCSRRGRERPGSWSIRRAGSWCATRRSHSGWAGIGLSTASDRAACTASRTSPAGWRRWPRNTWPPSERSSRADLTSSGVGPPGDWSPWRWPSSFWRKASRSRCSPCSTRSPRRPMIRTGPTSRAMEYGLDLSLEELSRLGPDQQLPYLWQHALKLGLIESSVPMQFAHQVLDDLKRIFHHHMVLTDHYVVRPYPGRITLIRPSDAPFAVPTPHDRGWGRLAAERRSPFRPRPAP